MRLDLYVAKEGYAVSRSEAQSLIRSGKVTVDGAVCRKPATPVADGTAVSVDRTECRYVGRGGLKLAGALDVFDVDVTGRMALDIGASSGGFTDCLLQNGARHVLAVDAGSGQMAKVLREDSRVTVIENYNARYMCPTDFPYVPDLAVMDVSFISATLIFPALYPVLSPESDFICLVKPQFEVGRAGLGKGGIVKSRALREEALRRVIRSATEQGFDFVGQAESPIAGGDGNTEYLVHFRKKEGSGDK